MEQQVNTSQYSISDTFKFWHHYDVHRLAHHHARGAAQDRQAYYINFIIQCKYEGISEYKRYRVCLCRDGIKSIEEKKQ